MCQIPTSAFKDLPTGTRFVLERASPHGSAVLETIEPLPYVTPNGVSFEGLFYTAKWCDGPHAGTLCVIPHGQDKMPFQVVALP